MRGIGPGGMGDDRSFPRCEGWGTLFGSLCSQSRSRAYNEAVTLEEHLACPKCGYDLHGIPEARCPECGFGYDAAAIRAMAVHAESMRFGAARKLTGRATIVVAFALPVACVRFGADGWTALWIAVVAYLTAFVTWVLVTVAYRGLASVPGLFALLAGTGMAFGFTLLLFPIFSVAGSLLVLPFAWRIRLRHWLPLPPPGNGHSAELRRSVDRYSRAGTLLLIVATLLAAAAVQVL